MKFFKVADFNSKKNSGSHFKITINTWKCCWRNPGILSVRKSGNAVGDITDDITNSLCDMIIIITSEPKFWKGGELEPFALPLYILNACTFSRLLL